MTWNELSAQYKAAYKIVARERAMRDHVFPPGNLKRDEKLQEMDKLLAILTSFKDELKPHTEDYLEQEPLF